MSTFETFLRKKNKLSMSSDAIETIRLKEKYCNANIHDILEYLYIVLQNKISSNNPYDITFNFDYVKIYGKVSLLNAINNYSFKGIDYCYIQKFKDTLEGKSADFSISFNFKHTIFDSYVKFDDLHCEKLNFENTVFNKGARLRFINVHDITYEPKHLGGDVTFANKYFDNEENQMIDLNTKIGTFKYRHQITGTGFTFFVGINFEKIAYFTNSILDRVHFANMDLAKCLFISSKIDKTRFYHCDFPQEQNIFLPHSKDKINIPIWLIGIFFLLFLVVSVIYFEKDTLWFYIFVIPVFLIFGNLIFMPLAYLLQSLVSSNLSLNTHICVYDEIKQTNPMDFDQQKNFNSSIREVYRQLKINFQNNEDYQTAGDFYYSQRYFEIIHIETKDGKTLQWYLLNIHHWVNGFGERWLRPVMWIFLTVTLFMFMSTPNKDYISTPSTPIFLLQGYNQQTGKLDLNESNASHHFLNIANTTYMDTTNSYTTKPKENVIFAYDNIFDYHYTKQMIPMIRNDINSRFLYSISHFVLPFMSDQKRWFQTTNGKSLFLSTIETIFLWFFFGAFVLAIKNRIKR